MNPFSLLSPIVGGISNVLTARQERKKTETIAKAKIQNNMIDSENQQTLADKEWELVSKQMENQSWKDELAVGVVLMPLIVLEVGAIIDPMFGTTMLESSKIMIAGIKTMLGDFEYGHLVSVVILSSLGLKMRQK